MNLARLKIESLYEKKFKIFFSVYHTISRLHPSRQREPCVAYPVYAEYSVKLRNPSCSLLRNLASSPRWDSNLHIIVGTLYKTQVKPCMDYCSHWMGWLCQVRITNFVVNWEKIESKPKTTLSLILSCRALATGVELPRYLVFTVYISESVPWICTT